MSVTRQKDRYFVRQQVNGRDVRAYAPSKKIADQIDASLTSQRLGMRFGLPQDKPRITFEEWTQAWFGLFWQGMVSPRRPKQQTVARYVELLPRLRPLEALWLDEIGRVEVENVCSRAASQGRLDRSAKICAFVKRLLRDAKERGYLMDESALLARVAKPKPRQQKALSWAEVELLAGEMPEHIHRGVLFLALTGLRVSEFCALTDADVFLKSGPAEGSLAGSNRSHGAEEGPVDQAPDRVGGASYILVRQSKTDAGQRQVFLCREAARLVREQMLARPNARPGASRDGAAESRSRDQSYGDSARLLFPNERGGPYNKDTFGQTLRRAARRLGMEDIHPHTLRSTHMTLLAQSGVDVMIAKELMGWADATFASMLPIYRKVAGSEVQREVMRLDAFLDTADTMYPEGKSPSAAATAPGATQEV